MFASRVIVLVSMYPPPQALHKLVLFESWVDADADEDYTADEIELTTLSLNPAHSSFHSRGLTFSILPLQPLVMSRRQWAGCPDSEGSSFLPSFHPSESSAWLVRRPMQSPVNAHILTRRLETETRNNVIDTLEL